MKTRNHISKSIICLLMVVLCIAALSACNIFSTSKCDHEWGGWTVTKDATCEVAGVRSRTCAQCGETETAPVAATGHKWAEATCTAPKTCTVCQKTEGSALAHVYDEKVVKDEALKSAATEESAAIYYKSCSCGAISKNDAETFTHGAPLNHEHTYTAAVTEPTCLVDGYTTYTCAACGDSYKDNYTAALGHKGGTATCTELAKCEVCGLEYGELLAHDWVDATCTKEKHCSACGLTEGEKLAHTGGTATCTELAKCGVCGAEYGELLAHDWVDATCTKEKHCSVCGLTEGEKLAHTGGTATCTEQAKCDVCGNAYGAFGAHDWKDATCTEAKNCRLCGSFEGEALGHTGGTATCTNKAICERCSMAYGEIAAHSYDKNADPLRYLAKEATCESADEYYYSCSACGKCHDGEGAETFFDGEALEHDYVWVSNGDNTHTGTCQNGCNDTVTDTCTGGTATCTQKAVCEICQEYYGEALGHTWVDGEIITAPTCTSAGQKEQTCGCGASTTVSVPALQHSYSETTVEPSCLAQGYTVYTCEGCGHSYQGNYQNALGHSFGEWTVTKAATCTENGAQTHTCGCGAVETQVILASGHKHTAAVTKPTCVQKGYTTYTCSCGDSYVGDETDPAGHAWNIDAPTCTEDQVCDTCGERVDALGHDYKLSGSTVATCVAAATNTYTCENCKHSYTESVGTTIAHNIKDVTPVLVLNDGETCIYTEHYKCKDCGADVVGETVEKHEKYTAAIQTAATCTTEGTKILTCADCGYTKNETIPVDTTLGHTWVTGTISDGKRTDTCACGATKVVTVVTGDQANKVDDLKDTELSIGDANINFGDAADSIGNQTNNDVTVGAGTLDDDEKKDVLDDLDEEKLGQIGNNPIYNFTVTDTENNLITDFGGKEVTITIPYELAEGEDVDSIAIWFINDKGEVESIPATYNNGYVTFTTNHFSYYTVTRLTPAQRCEVYGHNFKESIVAPTCTAQGYTLQYCIRCRHSQMVNYVEPIGHEYTAATVKAATCTENGLIRYTCSTCKESYEEIIPAIKHNYEFFSETKGSCTEAGVITYKCTNCQGTKTEQTTTTGHSCVAVQTIASTCTMQGYTVYACQNEGCDYSYNGDYQAVVEHSFGEWVITQASTCTTEGEERRDCASCEHYETKKIAVVPHNYVATVTEPTCDQMGYTTYTCSLCQNSYTDNATDPIGHKYEATWDWADDKQTATITVTCQREGCQYNGTPVTRQINSECTVFDSTSKKEGRKEYRVHFEFDGHSFSDEQQEIIPVKEHSHEGCEMQYNKFNHWYKCPDCKGNSGKIPHEFDEGTVVKEATCKTEGEIVYRCECGYEKSESIPKNDNHTAGAEFYRDGLTHWNVCAECGEKLNEAEHAWDSGTLTKNVTCTENGIITYRCACGASKAEEVPALGHTEKQLPAIAPTCTESGLTAGVICETCGEVLVAQETVPALGHTEKQIPAIAPTCTESGLTAGVMCEICGEILAVQEIVPALGHNEEILPGISATCTEFGITEGKKCAACGEILVAQQEIPATGHSFGEWIETIAPTEEAAGEKTRYCANCDVTETSPIAALGHVHELHPVTVLEAVAATCTKNGLTAGEMCSGCGEVLVPQEIVPALGHKEDILAGKDATCGEIGLTEGAWCSACGEIFVAQEEIPATGNHTYENGICSGCGAEQLCDHTVLHEESLNAKDFGGCDWTLYYSVCDCGEVKIIDTEKSLLTCNFDDESAETEEGVDENGNPYAKLKMVCLDCGMSVEMYVSGIINGCVMTEEYTYAFAINGETIIEAGHSNTYENHNTVDENINLSDYGVCGGTLTVSRCMDCGKITGAYNFTLICDLNGTTTTTYDKVTDENGITHVIERTECSQCGFVKVCSSWMEQRTECESTEHRTTTLSSKTGVIAEYEEDWYSSNHQYVDWVETKAPTCNEWGERTCECGICGNKIHSMIQPTNEHSYVDGYCSVCGKEELDGYESAKDIYEAASKLEHNEYLEGEYTLTGIITSIDTLYSEQYGNVTVTIDVSGYSFKCYRLKGDGVDQIDIGDTITVTGRIMNYNGIVEFAAGCILDSYEKPDVDHEHTFVEMERVMPTCTTDGYVVAICSICGYTDTTVLNKMGHDYVDGVCTYCGKLLAPPDPTPDSTLTILEALEIAFGKDHNVFTEGKYYITGIIDSIANTTYGNMYIRDEAGNTFYVYGLYNSDGTVRFDAMEKQPVVGDTITIYGIIGHYNGNAQMKQAWLVDEIPGEDSDIKEDVALNGIINQNTLGQVLYLDGTLSGRYLNTTTDAALAVSVYAEKAEDGYKFYILVDGAKQYICIYNNQDGKLSVGYSADIQSVFRYDSETKAWISTLDGTDYYLGTYSKYATVSASKITYITPDNTGVSQFPLNFIVAGTDTPVVPGEPDTPDIPDIPDIPEDGVVSSTIEEIANKNGWESGMLYESFELGNGIIVSATGSSFGTYGLNTGKFYNSNYTWRLYQSESPILTITAPDGKIIEYVKITYISQNEGVLTLNGENIESDTIVTVGANAVIFGVGNTGDKTNGQARITAIEVCYKEENPCAHEYTETERVEPNCTTDGYVTKVCGLCGKSVTEKIPALGHTLGEFAYTKAPTCTEQGEMSATCAVCGEIVIEYIPALGHNIENGYCTICGQPVSCETHSYLVDYVNNPQRFEKTWGICTVCGYVDDNHEHRIEGGKCVYCDYTFEYSEVASQFDNDGDGNNDVYFFAAALPEQFNDAIRIDAFKDAASDGNHMEYDEIRAGYLDKYPNPMPYPHVYCSDLSANELIYTIYVEEAGTYEMAVHLRIKDNRVRGAKYVINKGTENEYAFSTSYEWSSTDDAYAVRNNDLLIGAYMYGITVELQAGKNTIHITNDESIVKPQHFRDFYLVPLDTCAHEYTEIERVEPTCTTDGYVTKVCGLCGKSITEKIPAYGHTPGEFVEIKAPTCTEQGEMSATCTVCGDVLFTYISALGHSYGEFVEIKAPTCTEKGEQVATCAICGETITVYIPARGHSMENGVCTVCGIIGLPECETHSYDIDLINNAQRFEKTYGICTVCGYVNDEHTHKIEAGKCVYCDYEFYTTDVVSRFDADGDGANDVYKFSAALPEKFNDAIRLDAYKDSTGSHMEYDEIRAGTATRMPYAHVYCADGVATDSIMFTFTVEEAGIYEVAVHIRLKDQKERGATFIINEGTANEQVIPATYGWATADEALMVRDSDWLQSAYYTGLSFELQEGVNTISIKIAEGVAKIQHFRDLYLIPLDTCKHEYTEIERVEPTCTTDGYVTKVCGLCEKVKTTKLPALGHTAGEWTVVMEPTCTTEGQMSTICTVCGETVLTVLPAFGHSFGNYTETKAPTCTEYGEWMETCYTCGATQTGILYPLGHSWDTWEDTKLPTCTENGERVYHCACGETMTETLWSYGHALTDIVVTKEATCTENGEQVGTCINCGETITEILYATGHYETYERIYLSDLGITCGGYVRIYTCRVCGENTNNRFTEYCAWSDSGIDEATGAHIYTCSYCGAVKHEHTETQYTDVACKYTVVETRTYYVAGEAVLTVVTQTHHEDHEWQYEFVLNGTSCDDGYTVKETCKTCDWLREFTNYGHTLYRVEYYDFTEYGACRGYLELMACPCGEHTRYNTNYCSMNTISSDSYVDENGVEHTVTVYQCPTCGLTRTRDRHYEDEGCYTYRYYTYTFTMGEVEIGSYTEKTHYDTHHEYEYTYTFLDEANRNCEAGVTVKETCRNCDHVSEWTDYGHNTRRVAYYDFTKYGACYGYLEVYSCACGQEGWSNTHYCAHNYVSSDTYTDEAGFEHRVEVYECPTCGLKRTSDYYDVREGCYTYRYYTESYAIGETEIGTASWKSQHREHHEYEYTYTFQDEANKNCEAGVTVVTTCKNCDYRSQSYRAHHQNDTFFYSDWYDCCDNHDVQVYGCPCGEQFNIQFNDYTFQYNEETQTYTCESCALTVSKVLEVTENGCSRTETTTFVACLAGEEKYRFVNEEICANHSYGDVKVTVSDGITVASAKCSKCGDEITFEMQQAVLENHEGMYYYDYTFIPEISAMYAIQSYSNSDTYVTLYELVDGQLVQLAYNDDYNGNQFYLTANLEAGKTYVYRIRFYHSNESGTIVFTLTQYATQATTNCKHNSAKEFAVLAEGATSCTDGVFSGTLCPECGRLTQTRFATSHETHRIAYYDLCDYGACHGYIEIWSCACGYNQRANANYCANSTVSSETFVDENGVEHTVTVYQCPTCGLTRTRDRYYEDEGCYTYRYYIYTFTMGEVEIASYTTKSQNSTHHEYENTYTFQDEANKNCEAGVTVVTTCKNCDYRSESYYTHHATFRTEYYDFTEYGACYGYLEVYSCACGQETGINRSYCSHNYVSNSNYVDEAGVKHYVDVYECPTCGLTRTCDYYDQREGCDIYRYYTESYTIGETEIGSGSYKSHYDTRHEYEYTYTFQDEANKNCEAGVTVVTTCKNCDYHSESYYTHHATFRTEYYDFTEYGADGGYAYVNTCACGYSTSVSFNSCSHGYNHNTSEYTDEEGIRWYVETWTSPCDCNIRFDRAYRYEHDTENCLRTYYYEESLSVGNALIDLGTRTTSEVYHEYEIRVELMEGATDCGQGVLVIHDCRYCDEQYTNNVYHHYNAEIARFDLTQYGAVCEGYAVINGCACGYNRSLSISNSDCAFEHRSTVNWVEGTINDYQYTAEGHRSFYSYSYTYTCAVTDPTQCGFAIRYSTYWRKNADCSATKYLTVQFGYDEATGTCQHEVTYEFVGQTYTYHNYERTNVDNGNGHIDTCPDCGSYYSYINYYNEQGIHIKQQEIWENKLDDGCSKYRENTYEYAGTHEGRWGNYQTSSYHKYIDANDVETWDKWEYSYAEYEAPFGENGYIRTEKYSSSSEYSYTHEYTYTYYKGYEFTLCNRYTEGDYWRQYDYTYDFTDGCKRWEVYTNSDGANDQSGPYDAHPTSYHQTVTPPTCTQYGVRGRYCPVCDAHWNDQPVSPIGHNWILLSDNLYYCGNCGLQNINGANGDIVMEDLTEKYGNGEAYVIGYWKNTTVRFTPYVTIYLNTPITTEWGEEEAFILLLTDDQFHFVEDEYVGLYVTLADIQAAVEMLCLDYGVETFTPDMYVVSISFVPDGADDNFDYAIVFDDLPGSEDADYTVKNDEFMTDYIASGKYLEYTILPEDTAKWTITTHSSSNWVIAYLYDGEGNLINNYWYNYGRNVRFNYTFVEGKTYVLRVQFESSSYEGYVPVEFNKGHVHTVEIVPAIEPTCTSAGWTEGKRCSDCGETVVSQEWIASLGHISEDWVVEREPTCYSSGYRYAVCTRCNQTVSEYIDTLNHSWGEWTNIQEATCTQDGINMAICSACNYISYSYYRTHYGHNFVNDTCTNCGAGIEEHNHSFSQGKCSVCGYIPVIGTDSAVDHDGDGTNEYYYFTPVLPEKFAAEGATHVWAGDYIVDLSSSNIYSSTSGGMNHWYLPEYTNDYIVYKVTVAEAGTYEMAIHLRLSDTTQRGAKYTVNPGTENEYTFETSYTFYDYSDFEVARYDSYTRTSYMRGIYVDLQAGDNYIKIERSGSIYYTQCYRDFYFVKVEDAHEYVETERVEATCQSDGYIVKTCATCGESIQQFLRVTDHAWSEYVEVMAPTCSAYGYSAATCSHCGLTTYSHYLNGHVWGDWVHVKDATCGSFGADSHTCTVCGRTENNVLYPNGEHSLGEWVETVAPTCDAYGEKKATCSVCSTDVYELISPLGHTLGEWVETVAPTCAENGERQAVCTVCGGTTYEWIAPLGHTIQDGVCTVCGQLPSCDGEHSYDIDLLNNAQRFEKTWGVCTVCGYINDEHTHKVENGKCVYCDYEFSTSDVTSAFDADGDGALDVYKFSAALPEKFNNAIRLDAYKDSIGSFITYDEIRAGSVTKMPYAHSYCGDGVTTDHITFTVNVEKAGIYEVAVHIRLKDNKERGATFVINEGTANEQLIKATYGWATADEALMVRDSDYLQSAYYTGLKFNLQAGENTIAIKVADNASKKSQQFRDLYLVWSADLPTDGEDVAPDLPYIPEDSFTAVDGSDSNTAYAFDTAATNSFGKEETVEE